MTDSWKASFIPYVLIEISSQHILPKIVFAYPIPKQLQPPKNHTNVSPR